MRPSVIAVALAVAPAGARAWVVVRAPVYYAPRPVVYVAPAPVYVAPAPVYVASDPVYVAPAPPAQPPPSTTKLPIDTSMWTLPSGCLQVSVDGLTYFQCGPNWLRAFQSDRGTYYAVVAPPR
jgi:YHS domain-containing protein